jgi:transcriptional regulator with XRE-family HTH domain
LLQFDYQANRFMKKKSNIKKSIPVKRIRNEVYNKTGELVFDRVKFRLDEQKKNFTDLAVELGITNSSLYRAMKRGKLTLEMMERIAVIIEVPVTYFFETVVVDRIADEVIQYEKNPDLKSFMLSFTRELGKGFSLESSVGLSIDKEAFWKKTV